MILVVYVIPCILSFDFNKLPILYIHVHIYLSYLLQKVCDAFFLSIKYLSVCLSCPKALIDNLNVIHLSVSAYIHVSCVLTDTAIVV